MRVKSKGKVGSNEGTDVKHGRYGSVPMNHSVAYCQSVRGSLICKLSKKSEMCMAIHVLLSVPKEEKTT
jgi:hypothetical protein